MTKERIETCVNPPSPPLAPQVCPTRRLYRSLRRQADLFGDGYTVPASPPSANYDSTGFDSSSANSSTANGGTCPPRGQGSAQASGWLRLRTGLRWDQSDVAEADVGAPCLQSGMADDGPVRLQPVDLAAVEQDSDYSVLAPYIHLVPLAGRLLGVDRRSEAWPSAVANDVTRSGRGPGDRRSVGKSEAASPARLPSSRGAELDHPVAVGGGPSWRGDLGSSRG
jgi:hypothetical protein